MILRYLGLGLFSVGFPAVLRAEATLGKEFSIDVTIQDGHKLVTEGLYHYVRHPRYLGFIMTITGFSLVFRSCFGLTLMVAMILVLIWRIHDEEALMKGEFGLEWQDYSRRSWRLVPFLY
jgi:protein-S-isoprenylcysteine O-methyltransferase Ste14